MVVETVQPKNVNMINEATQTQQNSKPLKLTSNGGLIESDSIDYLKPTYITDSDEVIRERYEKDGYVLMKNLIPKEVIREMRRKLVFKFYFKYKIIVKQIRLDTLNLYNVQAYLKKVLTLLMEYLSVVIQ